MDACNVVHEIKKETIVYTTFPALNDLRCAICEIDFVETHDSSAKSNFHWKTMKCRLIIHLVPDIIASPVLGTETFIFVIAHKQFYDTGKLEKILKHFKLLYRGLRPVTMEVYKSCLIYTIQAKIAPLWNKAGQYFIEGKEFYNIIEGARALMLDALMKDTNMCLKLHAERIKIPHIKLEDYLPASVISQFLADPKGYLNLSLYKFPFVHILPSTKKGKLLSVSKEIPSKCPFKDYDQLRRHWKNMYGYSLPKNKDGILYYEIKFLIPKANIFIYPNLCVMSGPLDIIPSRDKEPTITRFLSDLLVKVPTICNKKLQISKDVPLNTVGNANSLADTLLNNAELDTNSPKNNPTSDSHLEFSAKYVDGLKKDASSIPTSLETRLAMIHQLHNAPFGESTATNLSIKNIKENQDGIMQPKKKLCVENNTAPVMNSNFIASKEGTISRYFPIQKPHSSNNTTESTQREEQEHLSIKEKLLKAKSSELSKTSLPKTDENVNIEAMAKSNQLHELKNNILSDWLKKHSIPHNSHGKKSELIKKILSHIKNTQVLHQFRI